MSWIHTEKRKKEGIRLDPASSLNSFMWMCRSTSKLWIPCTFILPYIPVSMKLTYKSQHSWKLLGFFWYAHVKHGINGFWTFHSIYYWSYSRNTNSCLFLYGTNCDCTNHLNLSSKNPTFIICLSLDQVEQSDCLFVCYFKLKNVACWIRPFAQINLDKIKSSLVLWLIAACSLMD